MSSANYRTGKESNESSSNEEDSHEVIVDRINKESLELKCSVKECSATENVTCSANSEEEKSSSEESAMSIINKNESWKGESVATLLKNDDNIHQSLMNYMDLKGDFMDIEVASKYEFIDFESIKNVEYLKINKIDMLSNTTKILYYSNNDFMKYKESFVNLANGNEESYSYSNYKKTEYGLMMPYNFNIGFGEINVKKYIFNQPFEKMMFIPEFQMESNKNGKASQIERR